jgi:hypothetical protein
VLVALPGIFWLLVKLGSRLSNASLPSRRAFIHFAAALVPLGLAAWIAFSLSFVLVNLSYIGAVLSDPFGWGWNLFGTADGIWTPYLTQIVPILQSGVLIGGLVWAVFAVWRLAGEHLSGRSVLAQALPVLVFCFTMTVALLGVLVA